MINRKSPKKEILCNSLIMVLISTKIIIMMIRMMVEIPIKILFTFKVIIVNITNSKMISLNLSDILDQNCKYL